MEQKLNTFFDKKDIKKTLLNTAYVLFLLSLLILFIKQLFKSYSYESNLTSEFLINYQGGFVRRGLMGEILLFFAKNFDINIEWTIKIVCMLALVVVCFLFIKLFLKKGYSLYILPLCFFLGSGILSGFWIRKDYLFFCFFIPVLYLYNKNNLSVFAKMVFINILAIFIILSHEVFAFFALPILYLLLFNQYKAKGILRSSVFSFLCLLPSIFAFVLTILYHGDPQTAQSIWASWSGILDKETSRIGWSVSAIGWSSKSAIIMHLKINFLYKDQGILYFLMWFVTFPVVYYISTNALLTFRKNDTVFTNQHKTVLSSILIFQLLCLSPVFIALSCDYIRTFFYWIASSYAVFLIIPINQTEKLFPSFFVRFVESKNAGLLKILHPTKTALVFLMMFIGISGYWCIIEWAYKNTMIYNILLVLSDFFIIIRKIVLTIL